MSESRSIGLDIPRAIAISLVVVSHIAKKLEVMGVLGVELFFALSGFLIGRILIRQLFAPDWNFLSLRQFWLRRWYRTLPNYYLFLAISLVFHHFFGGEILGVKLIKFFFFSQNLLSPNEFFYGVSWSLCIEEWFYLIFSGMLFTVGFCIFDKNLRLIVCILTIIIVSVIARSFLISSTPPASVRLMTLPRLDAVLYGVLIAYIQHRFGKRRLNNAVCFALGVLLSSLAGWMVRGDASATVLAWQLAFIFLPLGFALTLPLLASLHFLSGPISFLNAPIQRISLWAYSIYLSHIPILFCVYASFGDQRTDIAWNIISKVLAVIITLYVSSLIYRRFEKPLTNLRPQVSQATRLLA